MPSEAASGDPYIATRRRPGNIRSPPPGSSWPARATSTSRASRSRSASAHVLVVPASSHGSLLVTRSSARVFVSWARSAAAETIRAPVAMASTSIRGRAGSSSRISSTARPPSGSGASPRPSRGRWSTVLPSTVTTRTSRGPKPGVSCSLGVLVAAVATVSGPACTATTTSVPRRSSRPSRPSVSAGTSGASTCSATRRAWASTSASATTTTGEWSTVASSTATTAAPASSPSAR